MEGSSAIILRLGNVLREREREKRGGKRRKERGVLCQRCSRSVTTIALGLAVVVAGLLLLGIVSGLTARLGLSINLILCFDVSRC